MYFSSHIPPVALWALCLCAACVLMLAVIYMLKVQTVTAFRRRSLRQRVDKDDADFEPASVIVYSQGDNEYLEQQLRTILGQNYPAPFEVIVVNDGESTDVRDTVSMLRAAHSNIYLTFTPEGVVNLSRKKLALTLGIKAARYGTVVLTTAAADIESDLWLRRMMEPFCRGGKTEVALGYAYVDSAEDSAFGRRRRAFDHTADSVRWIGAAVSGRPFRGTEHNIAYRKDTFMRNKGFARRLNLCNGDDDIFISEIATGDNTAVVLTEDSPVRMRQGNHPRLFRERMTRRFFTERFIRRRPRVLFALTGWLQIVAFAAAVAAAVIAFPNLSGIAGAAVLILLMCVLDIIIWRQAMTAMMSRRLLLTIPWLSATYPLRRMAGRIRSRFGKQKKYTWD